MTMQDNNLQTEIWIQDSEYPRYEVSNQGRVRNIETGRIIKSQNNPHVEYEQVSLSKATGRKTIFVHRLVWHAFHGEWSNDIFQIDHINDNKIDNRLSNLRLVHKRENIAKARQQRNLPTGVTQTPNGRFKARAGSRYVNDGKPVHLGYFATLEEAHQAYLNKVKEFNQLDKDAANGKI